MDETLAHVFGDGKPIKYDEAIVQTMNLENEAKPKNILVGDN